MKHPKFGDLVRNNSAGPDNPQCEGIFVKATNYDRRVNGGTWYLITDGNGAFWETHPSSIEILRTNSAREAERGQIESLRELHFIVHALRMVVYSDVEHLWRLDVLGDGSRLESFEVKACTFSEALSLSLSAAVAALSPTIQNEANKETL